MINYIEIKAPAKINIGLNIIRKRIDGYHDIETIFYPVKDLFDLVTIRRADKFSFNCSDAALSDNSNLIVKTKNILESETKKEIKAEVFLEKKIPTGAGLGGGSSDAAAAMLAFNDMFSLGLSIDRLKELALNLGSDAPFFIRPQPCFAESRGERIFPIDFEINYPILIINPGVHVSTKEAYAGVKPQIPSFSLKNNFKKINFKSEAVKLVINDFENLIFKKHPEIKHLKDMLYKFGAFFALMSGSGSTVYGIFNDYGQAIKAKNCFEKDNYFSFINRTET